MGITYSDTLGTIFRNLNLSIIPKSYEHLPPFNTKLLHHIMISILLPKQHHYDEVRQMELETMY